MRAIHRQTVRLLLVPLLCGLAANAAGHPVVYTLHTVADGKLGHHVFSEALVTIQMRADTATVKQQPSAVAGGTVYSNTGVVTVTVGEGSRETVATFSPGEVYVQYDTGTGIAGFGSPISPVYPIALDCSESTGCSQGDGDVLGAGTLGALVGGAASPVSAATKLLPASLAQSTLLTGPAFTCAKAYTVYAGAYPVLGVCSGPAPRGLHTDHGDFYLQDQVGGSSGDPIPADAPAQIYYGWDLANYGSLLVEVMDR